MRKSVSTYVAHGNANYLMLLYVECQLLWHLTPKIRKRLISLCIGLLHVRWITTWLDCIFGLSLSKDARYTRFGQTLWLCFCGRSSKGCGGNVRSYKAASAFLLRQVNEGTPPVLLMGVPAACNHVVAVGADFQAPFTASLCTEQHLTRNGALAIDPGAEPDHSSPRL